MRQDTSDVPQGARLLVVLVQAGLHIYVARSLGHSINRKTGYTKTVYMEEANTWILLLVLCCVIFPPFATCVRSNDSMPVHCDGSLVALWLPLAPN